LCARRFAQFVPAAAAETSRQNHIKQMTSLLNFVKPASN
jgi:hypothetical protein